MRWNEEEVVGGWRRYERNEARLRWLHFEVCSGAYAGDALQGVKRAGEGVPSPTLVVCMAHVEGTMCP